jgi:Zn-dependent peptidase ImmA (M78 family)
MKPLPKRHRFPGGFVVEIVLADIDPTEAGTYETPEIGRGIITIDRHRTPRQRWHDLGHELMHAAVDAQNFIERKVAP